MPASGSCRPAQANLGRPSHHYRHGTYEVALLASPTERRLAISCPSSPSPFILHSQSEGPSSADSPCCVASHPVRLCVIGRARSSQHHLWPMTKAVGWPVITRDPWLGHE